MRIKEGFVMRQICGEHIISAEGMENINFNKLISLNESAAYLWESVEGKEFTEKDLAGLLIGKYGIDEALAAKDSAAIAKAWHEAGLVE
ncbi:MAG: PqqD family protein [Candidatus Cryptobacteroides sp.]